MWYESTNLIEMQRDIARIFEENMRLHKNVCDCIDLSYNDYQLMVSRLRLINTPEEIEHYSLSILVSWVTSYRYNRENEFFELAKHIVSAMPQHQTKYVLEAINDMCDDYQIDLYGYKMSNLASIRAIIRKHAGF